MSDLFVDFPVDDIGQLPVHKPFAIPANGGFSDAYHQFDAEHVLAIQAAWYAKRPLLVKGDPGLGKSQLAHALAHCLGWNLLLHVIHSRTEPDDLLFRVDHVARLAKAQLLQAGQGKMSDIHHQNFIIPGPLWWAYSPDTAQEFYASKGKDYTSQYKPDFAKPFVILMDEIDKAPRELPNSLLEVLNNQSFHVPFYDEPISMSAPRAPFVVITSNDERALPTAFLRRCVQLNMQMKSGDDGIAQLKRVASAHSERISKLGDEVIAKAAKTVIEYRDSLSDADYKPGTSEFLDMLHVLNDHKGYQDDDARLAFLDDVAPYLLHKS